MNGIIINFRGSQKTQHNNQMVVQPETGKTKADASKLLGKKVEWLTASGKIMSGKVTRVHGCKGCVIAKFDPPLPGQAIGTEVKIVV